ncbi:hypothetical protein BN7_2763 [Wickerhamomyces ciferrii]|uniref:F-box domain-containing protein n=1 Tax=Wickerhamomyces ciferrii (strain ATCC 14091 / BCRC 22168 / CBS 111 / JCM 3599 / NBRC 0793 / NRRL Y-1031 F-60-10) TaxID=1206466 RepID=K0KJU5_WICCF|nr:uncharacterized protein BN7_2763 [Wickerhamomyces ciferrii]CCH43216.1 hypothetical protein BN7_2763 [Wickerhamomyces ciferrii]
MNWNILDNLPYEIHIQILDSLILTNDIFNYLKIVPKLQDYFAKHYILISDKINKEKYSHLPNESLIFLNDCDIKSQEWSKKLHDFGGVLLWECYSVYNSYDKLTELKPSGLMIKGEPKKSMKLKITVYENLTKVSFLFQNLFDIGPKLISLHAPNCQEMIIYQTSLPSKSMFIFDQLQKLKLINVKKFNKVWNDCSQLKSLELQLLPDSFSISKDFQYPERLLANSNQPKTLLLKNSMCANLIYLYLYDTIRGCGPGIDSLCDLNFPKLKVLEIKYCRTFKSIINMSAEKLQNFTCISPSSIIRIDGLETPVLKNFIIDVKSCTIDNFKKPQSLKIFEITESNNCVSNAGNHL